MRECKFKNVFLNIKKEEYINFILDNDIWQEFMIYLSLKKRGIYDERNEKSNKFYKNLEIQKKK